MSERPTAQLTIDLDHTSFNTPRFSRHIMRAIHAGFSIKPELFAADMPRHRHVRGGLRHYDFYAHMQDYGIDSSDVEQCLADRLAGQQYNYPDVPGVVDRAKRAGMTVNLLTRGEDRFQRLKASMGGILGELTVHTVLEPKGPYIASELAYDPTIVLDDIVITDLPGFARQFVVDRYHNRQGTYPDLESSWPDIYSAVRESSDVC